MCRRLLAVSVALGMVAAFPLIDRTAPPAGAVAKFYGSTGALTLNAPIVGMAATPTGKGYWLVASDGGIFAFGDARFFGSAGGAAHPAPIVGMAATRTGKGYWLVGADSSVFTYGDAVFSGSAAGMSPSRVVGIAPTTTGAGYWVATANGTVISFGDAGFFGSLAGVSLKAPIVGITTATHDDGYWLVASDGGVFSFGSAEFFGSTGRVHLVRPIVGLIASPFNGGYWLVASDGGVFAFGPDAPFYGSAGALTLSAPVLGGTAAADARGYWLVASDGGIFTYPGKPLARRGGLGLIPRRLARNRAPLRVLTLGDSYTISMQDGLAKVLRRTGKALVIPDGRWAFGFTAQYPILPPCDFCDPLLDDTPANLTNRAWHINYDAAVLMVGGWDTASRKVGNKEYHPFDADWQHWYKGIQDDAIERLTSRHGAVIWVGYPACNGSDPVHAKINVMSAAATKRHPGKAVFLDLHARVCPTGTLKPLTLPDGSPVTLLMSNGHFTAQGAEWLGYWIKSKIRSTFGL